MHALGSGEPPIFFWILFPLVVAFAIANLIWRSKRKTRVLEQWAAREGFRLVHYEERWLARGPFIFAALKGPAVYRITVEYSDGRVVTGWAICGAWLFGLLSDEVQVRWDNEKPQAPGFPVIIKGQRKKITRMPEVATAVFQIVRQ